MEEILDRGADALVGRPAAAKAPATPHGAARPTTGNAMVMVWAANLSFATTSSDVRIVETFGDAVAWVDNNPDEPLLVIGPDVRFIDATAFAGYIRRVRPGTPVVLVRHPEEGDLAGEARVAGVAEVVLSSSTTGSEPSTAEPVIPESTVLADAAELLASCLRDRLNVEISLARPAPATTD